ncbi:hypothetical protein PHMEG_00020467 [Phytophthora megakarya]|uniref:Retrovirus-related Pol polyprotein from transposon TNT 1-94-like beta-barrel domain-containing protein n=1 Tax=Phytophthora megakarya TaxID=4795 RepID=A0A225VP97_9STRA|nr:hypothetical protein PHMEG_00020467 [Phytophthora megakarya]
MSPSKVTSDDFPRLIGAENFDVWKTRVCAALDGKHLLGYVKNPDNDVISEYESDESESDVSDVDDFLKTKTNSTESAEIDSDAVDYEDSDDELKPLSDSDVESGGNSETATKRTKLPVRERRRQEAKAKAFLMKTMDTTHGAAFHGDPYFIQHYLMELKYEEDSELTDFFLKLENAMKAAQEATDSVMAEGQKSIYLFCGVAGSRFRFHSMPRSWKDDLPIWKGRRKYIPYQDLKQSIEGNVRDTLAQKRCTLAKGTPEATMTKNERALLVSGPPVSINQDSANDNVCYYCDKPRHNIHQPNSKRDYPYRNSKNGNRGSRNNNGNRGHIDNNGGNNNKRVGGNNPIPIEDIGCVELEVTDSKCNMKKFTLQGVLYAPQMQFSLLSIKAKMATNSDLYQFQAKPAARQIFIA